MMDINITIIGKTVNLHHKYLKQSLNLKNFILLSRVFVIFNTFSIITAMFCFGKLSFLLAIRDMAEHVFGILDLNYLVDNITPSPSHSISTHSQFTHYSILGLCTIFRVLGFCTIYIILGSFKIHYWDPLYNTYY